ncbi:glucose-6-phosphate isomerase [Zymomonas mobilis]|uniref:glucose-6-phosphate isomerase n=1 Tax=Zymomonas mobilis TaxID=542 RepID=UPI0039E9BF27
MARIANKAAIDAAWKQVSACSEKTLKQLFEEDSNRLSGLVVETAKLRFDFSKNHLDSQKLTAFKKLLEACDFDARRKALFAGEKINITEDRAVEHMAERGQGVPASVARAKEYHARMRTLIEAIDAGAFGEVKHLLHIGIGGSALGPKLLIDALTRESGRYDVAVVSNVDGQALEEVFKKFNPHKTLIAVASKTFTTAETMLNAESAMEWMKKHGVEDPQGRMIALTANPAKASEMGIDDTRILPFAESIGGRYSLWSSIGFPAALALGWEGFQQLLEGGAAMDRHFLEAAPEKNAPILAAFADQYYSAVRGAQTHGIFAYDERLQLLPFYLQQLEMESNGKRVDLDGNLIDHPSAFITWGGVGTDAQHAVFQLLHQGTRLVPIEFIAAIKADDTLNPVHHKTLLTNAFAQGAALMSGRDNKDPARSYPGDRPSTTILMEELRPAQLGALIAFYEHRTFTNGVLLGINSFDQFGVELGKEMAHAIADHPENSDFDPSTKALIAAALK